MDNTYLSISDKVYYYLTTIPKGKVVTYGQIAQYLGNKHLARVVGNILHENPDPQFFPCYKVVNSQGKLTKNFADGGIEVQKLRLENDGIKVIDYKVDLTKYQYKTSNYIKHLQDLNSLSNGNTA